MLKNQRCGPTAESGVSFEQKEQTQYWATAIAAGFAGELSMRYMERHCLNCIHF